ncbi:hypothetical protein TSOC_006258 [Tetrabaena socialis]|uniref:Uncharacterized protein n=1 Tax=Tetrabaena socialis TaxID=47790 RepID=A0A2J8A473_9CHLO|nr:hypothetical protein TSOC_006258 [Tetrabaena socialis]|eukprot:PNH07307.1 hypothetical protein TSOC_006258 [Tetrabaena socialis]
MAGKKSAGKKSHQPRPTDPTDPVEHLYHACDNNVFPTDATCLRAFLFDRCTDWPSLLGFYKGIVGPISRITRKDYREELRRAAQEGGVQLLDCVARISDDFHRSTGHAGSGYWQWFEANRAQLKAMVTKGPPPEHGSVVRLVGLTAASELNGAIGQVVREADGDDGRLPVKLRSPAAAVASKPGGVRVRLANLEALPLGAVEAVLLFGALVSPTYALGFGSQLAQGQRQQGTVDSSTLPDGWRRCEVPALLGLPLALFPLASNGSAGPLPGNNEKGSDESMAVFLLIDPASGFAPTDVQLGGLGPVLVARTDGKDFTPKELLQLHSYNQLLMQRWDRLAPHELGRALTPSAFNAFVREG